MRSLALVAALVTLLMPAHAVGQEDDGAFCEPSEVHEGCSYCQTGSDPEDCQNLFCCDEDPDTQEGYWTGVCDNELQRGACREVMDVPGRIP